MAEDYLRDFLDLREKQGDPLPAARQKKQGCSVIRKSRHQAESRHPCERIPEQTPIWSRPLW